MKRTIDFERDVTVCIECGCFVINELWEQHISFVHKRGPLRLPSRWPEAK